MHARKIALHLGLVFGMVTAAPAPCQDNGVVVPAFDGPQPLGENVSTNLYLQIWRTLRRAPSPNPHRLDFGTGIARYSKEVFRPLTASDVDEYVHSDGASQMIVWGEVRNLGDGVLVQAFLAAPFGSALPGHPEMWTIRRNGHSVSLDLPRRSFDFAPVVLDRDLVSQLHSPDVLTMCPDKHWPCNAVPVGDDWNAVRQEGSWAAVVSNPRNKAGFIYLPTLARLPNDISDFAAALLSYQRHDFEQAARLFSGVARRTSQESTRQDAEALAAIARARGGQLNGAEFARLEAEDPDSLYVFQAATMQLLDEAMANPNPAGRSTQLGRIRARVAANRDLFAADDPWLIGVQQVLGE